MRASPRVRFDFSELSSLALMEMFVFNNREIVQLVKEANRPEPEIAPIDSSGVLFGNSMSLRIICGIRLSLFF